MYCRHLVAILGAAVTMTSEYRRVTDASQRRVRMNISGLSAKSYHLLTHTHTVSVRKWRLFNLQKRYWRTKQPCVTNNSIFFLILIFGVSFPCAVFSWRCTNPTFNSAAVGSASKCLVILTKAKQSFQITCMFHAMHYGADMFSKEAVDM